MTVVEIGGIVFSPGLMPGLTRRDGFFFTSLIDWYSLPDSKSPVRERPQADGAFGISAEWRESAIISLEGRYLGASRADVLGAKKALKLALGRRQGPTMTVTDEDGPSSRVVSVRSMSIPDDFGKTDFTFTIDMIAADPRRYGPEEVVSTGLPTSGTGLVYEVVYPISYGTPGDPGRVVTTNTGTEDTFSLLEVTGGLGGGFELTEVHTGNVLRFDRVIPLGSTVFLNPRTGRVYIDNPGNDVSGFLTRREWWPVPAGGSREIQFNSIGAVTGTPTLTARTAPAN